jgi:tetratricopeptide (TPR) repeat protein
MNNFRNQELLDNADFCIKEGKLNDAFTILNDILMDDPLYGKAHNHLGYIYETKIRDYKKAEDHYKLCLQYSPEYAAAYYNYAILLSTLKNFDALAELLKKAETVPGINHATIANEWAIMYEAQGKMEEAITHYRKVIAQSFDNKTVDLAMESVARCEKKKGYLSGNTNIGSGSPVTPPPPGWRG